MALTPNEVTDEKPAGGNRWPTEDLAVVSWVADREKQADQGLSDWYELARTDFNFAENKQWDDADVLKLKSENRLAVTFNRIATTVNSIKGQEVCNRQEAKFLARRVGPVSGAEPMGDAVRWVRDGCNAEDEDSDAFGDMVTCGIGWTCARMNYEDDIEGKGEVVRRDPLLMRWDPSARQKNLADRRWNQSDYWMSKEAILERWPDADLAPLALLGDSPAERETPHDATEAWKYQNNQGNAHYQGQWRVVHHVERFTKPVHKVIDPTTGKVQLYSSADFAKIKEQAKQFPGYPPIKSVKVNQRVFWEAWTVGNVVLHSGEAEIQADFQYQAMTCYRERETGYWFGVVRLMLDPQRYANRLASLMMSILATGAKGGFMFETGAFANSKKAKQEWAKHDGAVEINAGFLEKVIPKPQSQMPPGAAEMMQFAIGSIRDATGVNLELLGAQNKEQPGIVEDMRTKAGMTILAPVFDAKRLYIKRQAIVLCEFVQKFLSDGRLIRVLGPEGQKFIPLLRDPSSVEYDIVVDESPASRDVKERTWLVMKELIPGMMQMGMPIPPTVLDYAPIPESLALDIKKAIAQKAQQPPQPPPEVMKAQAQAQAQQQIAMVKAQASQATEQARAQADVAIEHDKAQVQMQLAQMKMALDQKFQMQEASMSQHTEFLKAIIGAISKVEAARVTASMDTGEEFVKPEAYPQ